MSEERISAVSIQTPLSLITTHRHKVLPIDSYVKHDLNVVIRQDRQVGARVVTKANQGARVLTHFRVSSVRMQAKVGETTKWSE